MRAYCALACRPELADDACEAAFVDFVGRALTAGTEPDLEELLLKATRSAAAARFRVPESAQPTRPEQCAAVPELLAARANGELPDDQALAVHVKHCPRCSASAGQLGQADAAFGVALGWEGLGRDGESAPPEPPPSVVRVRRGGLVGRAKKLRSQLGGDAGTGDGT